MDSSFTYNCHLLVKPTGLQGNEECHYGNVQYFIMSNSGVSNVTTVRYSLQKCSETILV